MTSLIMEIVSLENMITVLRQASILLMLSLGLTGVVLTGNIDLSVGSFAALCGCISAQLLVLEYPAGLAVGAALLTGAVFGIVNGLLVGALKLPSFIATYGTNMVASGMATIVMNGGVIYGLPPYFTRLGIGRIGIVPVPVILAAIASGIFYWIFQKTVFGRELYLIGMNPVAARYSGLKTVRTIIAAYILCALTGAMGGIMMTARLNAADAGMTEAYGLRIVAAVVVGGNSLLGGEGGVLRTVAGAIILTLISNIMNIMGVQSEWQNLAVGVMILAMVGLDVLVRSRRTSRTGTGRSGRGPKSVSES